MMNVEMTPRAKIGFQAAEGEQQRRLGEIVRGWAVGVDLPRDQVSPSRERANVWVARVLDHVLVYRLENLEVLVLDVILAHPAVQIEPVGLAGTAGGQAA